jgi:IS30 family transposase
MASHLTLEEREGIAEMHRAGNVQTQIADRLGRSNSTISRELRRNRSRNGYWAVAARRKAEKRRSQRPWARKLERPEVRRFVHHAIGARTVQGFGPRGSTRLRMRDYDSTCTHCTC